MVAVADGAGAGARRARVAAAAAAAANQAGGEVAPEVGAVGVRNVSEVSSDLALGVDLDGDGIPDVSLAAMVSGRPGVGWKDEQDKRAYTLSILSMTYSSCWAATGSVASSV